MPNKQKLLVPEWDSGYFVDEAGMGAFRNGIPNELPEDLRERIVDAVQQNSNLWELTCEYFDRHNSNANYIAVLNNFLRERVVGLVGPPYSQVLLALEARVKGVTFEALHKERSKPIGKVGESELNSTDLNEIRRRAIKRATEPK